MLKSIKIISRVLILLFCFFLFLLILKQVLPIEYTDNSSEYFFENLLFFGFPICILLTLSVTLKKKDSTRNIIVKIIFTIVISLGVFLAIGISALSDMCGWQTEATLFESKQNSSIKIANRSFGCGATDSGSPTHSIFKIKQITPYFIWATKIDTNSIDKTKWIRIIKPSE